MSEANARGTDGERLSKRHERVCPICLRESAKPLVYDHCHDSEQFRAYICQGCNSGLGMFRDDENAMMRAVAYVMYHRERVRVGREMALTGTEQMMLFNHRRGAA